MKTPDAIQSFDPYRRGHGEAQPAPREEFSFDDVLDAVNPLQHIPVVGWIYREITGDVMGAPAAIAGGVLFGGPLGFAGAILTAAFERIAGETPAELVGKALSPAVRRQGIAAYGRAAGLAEG
jgi:hypothetical protein